MQLLALAAGDQAERANVARAPCICCPLAAVRLCRQGGASKYKEAVISLNCTLFSYGHQAACSQALGGGEGKWPLQNAGSHGPQTRWIRAPVTAACYRRSRSRSGSPCPPPGRRRCRHTTAHCQRPRRHAPAAAPAARELHGKHAVVECAGVLCLLCPAFPSPHSTLLRRPTTPPSAVGELYTHSALHRFVSAACAQLRSLLCTRRS